MAQTTTVTNEFNVYLANADNTATRTIKIPNTSVSLSDLPSLDSVRTQLAPLIPKSALNSDTTVAFFYDEGNQGGYDAPMTQITGAEVVQTTRIAAELE